MIKHDQYKNTTTNNNNDSGYNTGYYTINRSGNNTNSNVRDVDRLLSFKLAYNTNVNGPPVNNNNLGPSQQQQNNNNSLPPNNNSNTNGNTVNANDTEKMLADLIVENIKQNELSDPNNEVSADDIAAIINQKWPLANQTVIDLVTSMLSLMIQIH
jgi:hypothetical protein